MHGIEAEQFLEQLTIFRRHVAKLFAVVDFNIILGPVGGPGGKLKGPSATCRRRVDFNPAPCGATPTGHGPLASAAGLEVLFDGLDHDIAIKACCGLSVHAFVFRCGPGGVLVTRGLVCFCRLAQPGPCFPADGGEAIREERTMQEVF